MEIRHSKESTAAYARGTIVVDGMEVGLLSMPASMYDFFIETMWDGHAELESQSLIFEKRKFSG